MAEILQYFKTTQGTDLSRTNNLQIGQNFSSFFLRNGFKKKKKLRNFGHMSKLGVPYLPSSLVWTKISLDKYSYCLPYLPIQKVWTFSN